MAKIVHWNPEKGFGFCRGDDGQEYFVHYSCLYPHPRRGKNITGGKVEIVSTESTCGKKPQITMAGWGEPRLEKAQLKVVGGKLFVKWTELLGYSLVPAQPREIPTIEEDSVWEVICYGDGLIIPSHQLITKAEYEETLLLETYEKIRNSYVSWVKGALDRAQNSSKSALSMAELDFTNLSPAVVVGGVSRRAVVCHLTNTVYAEPVFDSYEEEVSRTSTFRGEEVSWGVGTFTSTSQKMISPEVAFEMPEELRLVPVFGGDSGLVEISYVPNTRLRICQTVAHRGAEIVAVWEDTKFFWSPAESCHKKYKIGERFHFPLSDIYSESDFYKIHMAVKQGLKLERSLIPWIGDLSI